jgi:predicted TIM-barrel fold metal-dependent hydrolase
VYFPQLPEVADLACAFPEATIVLNHLGGPITLGPYSDREAVLARWRPLIADVATCANVVLKVGGIGMPVYGMTWHKQEASPAAEEVARFWADPVRFAIDAFGPERCMLESNFPVDKFSMPYASLWEAMDILTDGYSPAERSALFHDTAVRTYHLDETSAA